ncbi:hypothetical protein UY3_10664 [Chelonia mydas]|uniref:Uncharacterized protein n=1 Tax=Chelonia mydas TaxID=8469 RepID=M7B9D2_CHEMY|nr:hypothetical protein UY3_10664 [Chelonia mydas]
MDMVVVSPMVVQAIAHYSVFTARTIEMAQMEDKLPIWYGTQPTQLQNLMKMAESCDYGGAEPVGTGHSRHNLAQLTFHTEGTTEALVALDKIQPFFKGLRVC